MSKEQRNLVSDVTGVARITNALTKNSWGLDFDRSTRTIWVSENASNRLVNYDVSGVATGRSVLVPQGLPTGIVELDPIKTKFEISTGVFASLIAVTENGQIVAAPDTALGGGNAITVYNGGSPAPIPAVFTGVAVSQEQFPKLYVANFRAGVVQVFSQTFSPLFDFKDPAFNPVFSPETLDYSPFNVVVRRDRVYVALALQAPGQQEPDPGVGNGYVDVFLLDGTLERRLINRGYLNAPWGMTFIRRNDREQEEEDQGFGWIEEDEKKDEDKKSGDEEEKVIKCRDHKRRDKDVEIWVGQNGSGRIERYSVWTGTYLGPVNDCNDLALVIDGIYGIDAAILRRRGVSVFFAAGINDGLNGLVGVLVPCDHREKDEDSSEHSRCKKREDKSEKSKSEKEKHKSKPCKCGRVH